MCPAPFFRRPTDQAVDSSQPQPQRYGVPDILKIQDVITGVHATEFLQWPDIEGYDILPSIDWIVRKKPTDINTIEIINTKTGLVQFSGTVLYPLFQNLNDSSDYKDGHQILITPTDQSASDSYLAIQGGLNLPVAVNWTKDVCVWGYGAKLRGGTTQHQSGGHFRVNADGKSLRMYGLEIDASNDGTGNTKSMGVLISGGEFGDSGTPYTPRLIHLRDCTFHNVYNRGVHLETANPTDPAGQQDATVIIESCRFDCGNTESIQTFMGINSAKFMRVHNCSFLGNNNVYSTAENIVITDCYFSQNGVDISNHHGGIGVQAKNIYIGNCTVIHKDGINCRSYGTIHAGYLVDRAERITIKGCTVAPWDDAQISDNILIQAYNDSDKSIDECTISDCYFKKDKPLNVSTADPNNLHGRIGKLIMENCYMGAFDGGSCIANIEDHDIEYLKIANINTPSWPQNVNASVFKLVAVNSAVTVGYAQILDTGKSQTGNEKFIATLNDSAPTGQNISVVFDSPLSAGQNQIRSLGTGTKTYKFLTNWGTAAFNGGSTTYNIAHSLVSSPSNGAIFVNAASSAARGDFHVTADSTNITVTFANAPASGTNNVVFYWRAVAA